MSGTAQLPANVVIVPSGFPSDATPECEHDWRVNPVVCATTDGPEWGRERELWMCVKCRIQVAGPKLGRYPPPSDPHARRGPFDPETWEKRP